MSSIFLIPIAIYTSFVFGINNSGLSTGSLLASGFSYKKGIGLTGIGLVAGALLEGWKMGGTLEGLTGSSSMSVLVITLIITGIVFSVFSFLGIPISLVNVLVGSYAGASLATGLSMNYSYMNILILSWIALPFVAAVATVGAYKLTVRLLNGVSLVGVGMFHLVTIPIIVFYTAYSLGANNIGLLYHLSLQGEQQYIHLLFLTLLPVASFFGVIKGGKSSMFVSEGVVGHSPLTIFSSLLVGAILTWMLTQVAIPVSLSQVLIGGLIGVNLYRKPRTYNKNALLKLIASWAGVTVTSFVAALGLGFII